MKQKSHTAKFAHFHQTESLNISENSFASCIALDITTIQNTVHLKFSKELLMSLTPNLRSIDHLIWALLIAYLCVWRDGVKNTEA